MPAVQSGPKQEVVADMKVEGWLFLGCGIFFAGATSCTGTPPRR